MNSVTTVPLLDLVFSLSDTVDLVSPELAGHNMEVAYMAGEIAGEYGLAPERRTEIVTAGALHDIGALSLKQKLANLSFEAKEPHQHAELSYLLLRTFPPFSETAALTRFHHVPWNGGEGARFNGAQVPLGSHILHLADRVSVLKDRSTHILNQSDEIRGRIKEQSGKMFEPELVEAFLGVSSRQSFWLDMSSPRIELPVSRGAAGRNLRLDMDGLLSFARLLARVIDFRSKYTATHSVGVGTVCRTLAELGGFDRGDCRMLEIAGCLHDLGKLAVPAEILEKPDKLTAEEYNIVKAHPFHTCRALQRVAGLESICGWASFHHERLNGCGYPYHLGAGELDQQARLLAVADVFTAILEKRPYHRDVQVSTAMEIMQKMADENALDPGAVDLLRRNRVKVNEARLESQTAAARDYGDFYIEGVLGPEKDCPKDLVECPLRL